MDSISSSSLKHQADQPVRNAAAWNWYSLSEDDYRQYQAPQQGISPNSILDSSSPLSQRAQYLLDLLDTQVRQRYPEQLSAVPKPKIALLIRPAANAFVSSISTCFDIKVEFAHGDQVPDQRDQSRCPAFTKRQLCTGNAG
ncbi:MAG: hypothetical protein NTX25_22540 [Proteobacteria bacterium]|nr:hypothetical protein [Pseudomonadota bacterium]